ncbi:MAG: rane protein [Betaproteobacteria bacterium]|nr:rane protein [Betaproteobacteria bacterium]
MNPEEKQRVLDDEHLRLLSLFHYISGAMTIFFSCFFIIHLVVMAYMSTHIPLGKNGQPDNFPFAIFTVVFGVVICVGIALGVMQIISGRALGRHRRRRLSMIVAAPGAMFMPYGTILSVMTWMVLSRPGVRAQYDENDD